MVNPSGFESSSNNDSSKNSAAGQPKMVSIFSSDSFGSLDWQSTKRELTERFEFIFQNGLYCDVQFIVGSGANIQTIGAHKLVLSAGSIIFLTMFSEKWSTECNEIEVPDVEPAVFTEMLRFLYSDKILLTSENVSEMLYVARKYSILALENKCIEFLLSSLSVENAFSILMQGRLFDIHKLVSAGLKLIAENTTEVLETDDFRNIDIETLCLVLDRSDLRIHESPLFDAVLRWSEAACQKEHLLVTPKNQRQVLKHALSLIRFPLMQPQDFVSKVANSGLLSKEEALSVTLLFIEKKYISCPFSNIPRKPFYVASRFRSIVYGGPYGSSLSTHNLSFKSDCNIDLLGIGLYGSPDHSVVYTVDSILHSTVVNEYNIIQSRQLQGQDSGTYICSKEIFRVMFSNPFELTANTVYHLQVKIQGEYFRYGCGGLSTKEVHINASKKTTITFISYENVSSEQDRGSKTDLHSGQIPEILFEL